MTKQQILTLTLSVIAISLLTSCGTSKSNQLDGSSNSITINSAQSMASCNQSTSDNFIFNIANTIDSASKQINSEWIKIKFSFLSEDITKTGYSFKFYKWRVIGGSTQLDPNPLTFSAYALSNGQTTGEMTTGILATQINKQTGFYIRMDDDANFPYQVLKVVAYKTDGTVAAQSDVLIPQFTASPISYKTNADGTVRSDSLQKLHPLNATDTTTWSQAQLKQNFDQYCF